MSKLRFRTTAKGNLPHLFYIFRKPDPMVTEVKTVSCYITGDVLLIGVQRWKEGLNHRKYHRANINVKGPVTSPRLR